MLHTLTEKQTPTHFLTSVRQKDKYMTKKKEKQKVDWDTQALNDLYSMKNIYGFHKKKKKKSGI